MIHKFLGVKFTIKDYVRTELPDEEGEGDEITENKMGEEDSEEDLEKELASEDDDIFGTKSGLKDKKEAVDTDTEKPR